MFSRLRLRAACPVLVAALLLSACGLPPLHRSVVVETDSNGVPAHASGRITHDRYAVVRGDTLYSIAFRADLDYHALARWNGIRPPYVIQPGQVLRLTRPAGVAAQTPSAPVFRTVTTPTQPAPPSPPPVRAVASSPPPPASSLPGKPVTAATVSAARQATATTAPPVTAPPVTAPPATVSAAPIPAGATRRVAGITWRWPASGDILSRFSPGDAKPGINIGGHAGEPVRAAASGVVLYSGNGLVGYGELIIIEHDNDYMSAYGHNSKRLVQEGEHVAAGQIIARMGSTGASRNELEFQVRYKGKPVDPLDYLPQR